MKSWLNKYFILFIAALPLMGCEKDEDKVILQEGTAPVLTVSSNEVVLTEESAADEAIKFSWQEADFGYNAAVSYTLQIDTANNEFATPFNVALGSSTEKAYTVEELNSLLTRLKYEADVAHDIKVRIRASVSDLVAPVYSDVETLNITPYSTYVEPSFIYVPGDYQGWSPETAPALISVNSDGVYKGYVSFLDNNNRKFKFTVNRDWNPNYGGGATAGSLAQDGADLEIATNDTYELTVDLNNMTWSSRKYSWGLIGDATLGGWDNDTNMTYVNEEGVWKVTTTLVPGKIKFRLNDAWDVNYGDDNTADNILNQGGADITIATAGTYDIVLDLENEDGSVTYTVTKR